MANMDDTPREGDSILFMLLLQSAYMSADVVEG